MLSTYTEYSQLLLYCTCIHVIKNYIHIPVFKKKKLNEKKTAKDIACMHGVIIGK